MNPINLEVDVLGYAGDRLIIKLPNGDNVCLDNVDIDEFNERLIEMGKEPIEEIITYAGN